MSPPILQAIEEALRRRLLAALVFRPNTVLRHRPSGAFLAGRRAAIPRLLRDAQTALGAFEFHMAGTNQRRHRCVREPLEGRTAAIPQCRIASHALRQQRTHLRQLELVPMRIYQCAYFIAHPSRRIRCGSSVLVD